MVCLSTSVIDANDIYRLYSKTAPRLILLRTLSHTCGVKTSDLFSPDLNPVDYAVWGTLQEKVYRRRRFTSVEQLKRAIIEEWDTLSQGFINRAIDEWRCRLESVVQQQGGHIEHCL